MVLGSFLSRFWLFDGFCLLPGFMAHSFLYYFLLYPGLVVRYLSSHLDALVVSDRSSVRLYMAFPCCC